MFNKTQRSIARSTLIAVAILLTIFVGNKLWQEYKLDVIIDIDTGAGGGVVANIAWQDNSDNEDGFVVERNEGGDFVVMARLNSNVTSYTDSNLVAGTAYCYRVGSFNQAGTAYTQEYCIDTPETDIVADTTLPDMTGSAMIIGQFITKPDVIELAGRELYSFKSDATYNGDFSKDDVGNVQYTIGEGSLSYSDSALFTFQDQGGDIDSGYVSMRYNESNSVSFSLNGNGDSQVASLYMSVGVWTSEPATFLITAGDTSEFISIPSGYTWHYLKIDIAFEDSVAVKIRPTGDFGSYSGLQVAGVVLNETSIPSSAPLTDISVPSIASLTGISLSDSENIDVSNVKYMTSDLISGNENLSNGEVIGIDYQGKVKYRDSTYSFIDNGAVVATGYTGMRWNEDNVISIDLKNSSEQLVSGSLFLRAGAWTDGSSQLQINLNGETYPIELSRGRAWYYIRVDFEFSGDAHVEIKPVGNIGSYSQIAFAGLTMQ
ncbi:hypothetical protein CXF72_18645 [Psychromonas sp. MB-3u-54]|uniref:fibronectin type III domain-containing protein n=1 Tax=Psychromonas sp. MB-3u-54 TaxID=2058319 RepID=UPI000C34C05E|nr:fibronectin type III domain-containing protein [Psychromonas sp. MB-3u-54]PKH01057.1 hypothetical protein CXF72_18645 [Psychromonas sp. MB-3u-54]